MHWEKQRIIECFSEIGYSIKNQCITNHNTFEENKLLSHDPSYNPYYSMILKNKQDMDS